MKNRFRPLAGAALIATAVMITGCGNLSSDKESTQTTYSHQAVDSLFTELIYRSEEVVENELDYQATANLDFQSLANEFYKYSGQGDMKANIGFIVSEMMALNKSESLLKVADSLDAYFGGFGTSEPTVSDVTGPMNRAAAENERGDRLRGIASKLYANRRKDNLISSSYRENGINGMAISMMARTPEVVLARSENPSWPQFITVSYIQDIIDNEIVPRLGRVIAACERIEKESYNESVIINAMDESTEVDVADIFLLEASIRALRSSLLIFTSYEWDLYAPGTSNYTWIDKLVDLEDQSSVKNYQRFTLRGDTLITTTYRPADRAIADYSYDLVKYNMERPGFCSLKQNNLGTAHNDLIAVAQKVKRAVAALKAENDSQEDDLLPVSELNNFEGDMISMKDRLLREEFTEEFAANFANPTTFANFVERVLSGPYTFDQSFSVTNGNKARINFSVDLSKFFTNPIQDFRDYLPLYEFRNKADIIEEDEYVREPYSSSYGSSSIYIYNNYYGEPIIDIPESMILSDNNNDWYREITLTREYFVEKYITVDEMFVPVYHLDHSGNRLTLEEVKTLIEEQHEIPYYEDYTVNGIFPGMSREKWNELLKNLNEL